MKCLICGKPTKNKIICPEHSNLSISTGSLIHECTSFLQAKDESEGICDSYLVCQTLKKALKGEIVFVSGLGQITCPHLYENIWKLKNTEFSEDSLKINYPECLD